MLASAPFVAVMRPRTALLPSPHWGELRCRLLPDSQSGITSRKCGLRGRPRGFRVPFGTGPKTEPCAQTQNKHRNMKHRQDWQNSEGRILTVNMIKEGSENKPALLILLNFYLEKSQKSNLSAKTNENGGKSHYEINVFFSNTRWSNPGWLWTWTSGQ